MDRNLLGKWAGDVGGTRIEILFNSDESFDTNIPFGGGTETFGVWLDKGGELLLTLEAGQLGFRYSISGNTLKLTNAKTGMSMELLKS